MPGDTQKGPREASGEWALPSFEGVKVIPRRIDCDYCEDVKLWSVSIVPQAGQERWSLTQVPDFDRGLALHRLKFWWMGPTIVRSHGGVPPETCFLMLNTADGSDNGECCLYMTVLQDWCRFWFVSEEGQLHLRMDGEGHTVHGKETEIMFVGTHPDPYTLVAAVMHKFRQRSAEPKLLEQGALDPSEFTTPELLDYFGWCTWDSFYTFVSQDKVLHGLETFQRAGLTPRLLVLDDGWQGASAIDVPVGEQWKGSLVTLRPNSKFTDEHGNCTLEHLTRTAREKYGVKEVIVWHGLLGYWRGLNLDSPEMQKYRPQLTKPKLQPIVTEHLEPSLVHQPWVAEGVGLYDAEKVGDFFNDYHRMLASMGIDGVKVDVQSSAATLAAERGGPMRFTQHVHNKLRESVLTNFHEHKASIIHCMCHSPENLAALYGAYDHRRPVVRGSDDYWPQFDSSHGPHLFINAYNAVMLAVLGVQDWDMFQTSAGRTSWMHAAARAISGGPIYVSDIPDDINISVIRRLAFSDGSISRCAQSAQPCRRTLFNDPQREVGIPLAIWNVNHLPGTGVVGVFHLLGAILDQRLAEFRYLRKDELVLTEEQRRDSELMAAIDTADRETTVPIEDFTGTGPVPRSEPMCIPFDWDIRVSDVEAIRRQALEGRLGEHPQFVGFRCKDERLILLRDVDEAVPTRLVCPFEFDIVTFSAIQRVDFADGEECMQWAPIGAVELFNPGGAVLKQEFRSQADSCATELHLRGSGKYLFYCTRQPARVFVRSNGNACRPSATHKFYEVAMKQAGADEPEVDGQILEIDLVKDSAQPSPGNIGCEPETTVLEIVFNRH